MMFVRGAEIDSDEIGLYWLGATAGFYYGIVLLVVEVEWQPFPSWLSSDAGFLLASAVTATLTIALAVWRRSELGSTEIGAYWICVVHAVALPVQILFVRMEWN
ncbi:unnamed protein product, partial [Phaeothamnion confervicola]